MTGGTLVGVKSEKKKQTIKLTIEINTDFQEAIIILLLYLFHSLFLWWSCSPLEEVEGGTLHAPHC